LVAAYANVNGASYFSRKENNPSYVRKKYVKRKFQKQLKNISESESIHV